MIRQTCSECGSDATHGKHGRSKGECSYGTPTGPVHFIYLGGPFEWQHWRAVWTARVHGTPIILWSAYDPVPFEIHVPGLEFRALELPDWLRDHPIQLANVKDLYAWELLLEHGGLYLDLDTISLRPVWDLLTRQMLVSREWPNPSDGEHQYNSAVVAACRGSAAAAWLYENAERLLIDGESRWGKTGPHLLTEALRQPDLAGDFDVAPFGALNGWRDDTIIEYYDGARPGPDVRVVHLYSSSRPYRFLADRWMP